MRVWVLDKSLNNDKLIHGNLHFKKGEHKMALGPKDLALTELELKQCDDYCEKLDAILKKCFQPRGVDQEILVAFGSEDGQIPKLSEHRRLSGEIERRYKDAGWKKKWVDSEWLVFFHTTMKLKKPLAFAGGFSFYLIPYLWYIRPWNRGLIPTMEKAMNRRWIFTPDDAKRFKEKGHLVVPLPDRQFLKRRINVIQEGLTRIESIKMEDALPFDMDRDNKDMIGRRLLQGLFRRPVDEMVQCNIADSSDGRMSDYRTILRKMGLDLDEFFTILVSLNDSARSGIDDLSRAIDKWVERAVAHGEIEAQRYSVYELLSHPRTKFITSATSYIAEYGSDHTSARPNTAAFAIYWFATNPGMQIFDTDGEPHNLSSVETDPGQIFIIPGTELTYGTRGLIRASRHPIFPKDDGKKRFTLRTFVYLSQELMARLVRENTSTDDILMRG